MKTQNILYLIGALALGLLGGYFLFGGQPAVAAAHTDHDHAATGESEGAATIWTCSMHPQIQQNEPGECPLCGMDLIPLEAGNSTDPAVLTMTEAAVAMARVRTMVVGGATPQGGAAAGASAASAEGARLELSGRLAPDARTAAVEVSEFPGRIERLFVSFAGEPVRAGQRIATVYSPDLVVAQEELLQAKKFTDLNPELVEAARTKLRNLKVTPQQITKLEETGTVLENFPVYADNNGTIIDMKTEVGEYVKAGGVLYTFTNLGRLWALFDAYEQDLARIRVGDRVSFTVAGLAGETFNARISFIEPTIDPKTRTAAVRAEVTNRNGRLKPEMFIEGTVALSGRAAAQRGEQAENGGWLVPKSAILWTGDRSVAYVELPDVAVPTYEFREVSLGERVGDAYRVTSGLAAGDRVVINGAFQLDAAAQLNNKASMMNQDVLVQGQDSAVEPVVPDYREGTPEAFRQQLGKVVEAYLPLKDQLVATLTVNQELIAPLDAAIAAVDMRLVKGEAHDYWMEQLAALNAHAAGILKQSDVEAQREQFGFLSQALINALTAFGVDGKYYVQHCPMAFDNDGANWLSNEEQILNPYFGDKMLKCGMVMEEF